MTTTEMRIAIAEKLGIVVRADGSWYRNTSTGCEDGHNFDPLSDLNAMHEAEKVLQDKDYPYGTWICYLSELCQICKGAPFAYHATAAQRAEAFCRTLWPEKFTQ